MRNTLSDDELIDLVFAVLEGDASRDQIRLVAETMARCATARRLYLGCLELHLQLKGAGWVPPGRPVA
jgi:hypothetical protein